MTKLIGVTGLAGSGKDTFAEGLVLRYGFRRMAFADPLKKAVAILFAIPESRAFSPDKDQVLDGWGLTLRDVLQRFGTEAMRGTFGPNFWIDRWLNEYRSIRDTTNVVMTDLRFENEAETVRLAGGTVVHVVRPGIDTSVVTYRHASEAGVAFQEGDVRIVNDGSIHDLHEKASALRRALNSIGAGQ